MKTTMQSADRARYRRIADLLQEAIMAGSLRPGDRLPSIRMLAQQHAVSVTTAMQACRQLENDMLVEARPKSGYFVRPQTTLHPAPATGGSIPLRIDGTSNVAMHQTVTEVMHLTKASCKVRLDIATGPAEIYPTKKLQQLIASISRRRPELLTDYPTGTGDPELKAQIARRALEAGCRISPAEIIITSGSTESLNLGCAP